MLHQKTGMADKYIFIPCPPLPYLERVFHILTGPVGDASKIRLFTQCM